MMNLDDLRIVNGLVARTKFLEWDKQRAIRDGKGLFTINRQLKGIHETLLKLGVNLSTPKATAGSAA